MMKKINFDSNTLTKVVGIGSAVVAGIAAVCNTLTQQKKEAEFKEMKNYIDALKKKES